MCKEVVTQGTGEVVLGRISVHVEQIDAAQVHLFGPSCLDREGFDVIVRDYLFCRAGVKVGGRGALVPFTGET